MILTRAFLPGPGADLESHAPGRAPDCAGLSIDGIRKKVERVFLSDWWRSPRHVANWNLNGSGNSDVAPTVITGSLIFYSKTSSCLWN